MKKLLFLPFFCLSFLSCQEQTATVSSEETPCQAYFGPLFYDVMACDSLFGPEKLFVESKTFLDLIPLRDMDAIKTDYEKWSNKSASGLQTFLEQNFKRYQYDALYSDSSDIDTHIKKLWKVLRRHPDSQAGTLIPLKHSYQVPGGRFSEVYYWDSYFTMLGMMVDGEEDTIRDMLDNFSDLILQVGFIPNGNRIYYLGRSQPPYFSYMVELLAQKDKEAPARYYDSLEKEYAFWMDGSERLSKDSMAIHHSVRMPDGEILNRYCDKFLTPRDEMYRNDLETGKKLQAQNPKADLPQLYQDLRSGSESGWDFSSRWFSDGQNLYTIRTTDIVPVDLNCLLYHLETVLAKYGKELNKTNASDYQKKAEQRKAAILKYCWNQKQNWFMDYNWKQQAQSTELTIAGVFPLFESLVPEEQGKLAAETLVKTFLKAGGVVTTLKNTGEQWDAPNGWAPHQWVSYLALQNYRMNTEAKQLKDSWMSMVEKVYASTHKLLEKYDVLKATNTGGGEYANQDGFGWTNGVYRALKTR